MAQVSATLESVTLIEVIKDSTYARLLLEFKDADPCYYNGDYNQILDYVAENATVMFDRVPGIHDRQQVDFANDLSVLQKVNVIESDDLLRLYPAEQPKNECDVGFEDIEEGNPPMRAILYCGKAEYITSKKAEWCELSLLDNQWKVSTAKNFSPNYKSKEFVGKYIRCLIWKTAYGLQVDEFEIVEEFRSLENPKMLLCERYIQAVLADDKKLEAEVSKNNLINVIKNFELDDDILIGYDLIRLAHEIYLAKAFTNMTRAYDIKTLIRYFVLSRLYKVVEKETTTLSPISLNIILFQRTSFVKDNVLLALLDPMSKVNLPERDIIDKIKEMIACITKADMTNEYKERRRV